ncbi:MAG TPA: L,D-transpeptidase family protein [Gammaproteobacteria bacterium]
MRRLRSASLLAMVLGLAGLDAGAAEYVLPKEHDVIGEVQRITAKYEDTFVKLGRRYGVGYEELKLANPNVDPWLPGEGTEIVVPTRFVLPRAPREGIVVNVAELRLYYFPKDEPDKVYTYPISIGRMDWSTPIGKTTVVGKVQNPSWYPPESIRKEHAERGDILPAVVPPGPDNPLGRHALRLGLPGYLIHGTNRPSGVGMRVTHGCIRMFPEDIEALFARVPVGTPVHIVNQPFKLGWNEEGALTLEVHPPLAEELEAGKWTLTDLTREIVAVTEEGFTDVDWDQAESVLRNPLGVPFPVSPAVEREEPVDDDAAADAEALEAAVLERAAEPSRPADDV